jgi:PPIC-type PPIASE domain.
MSGSNRKKERKEQINEVFGERMRKETAEAQKEKQLATIYKAVAVVVVVLVAALLLWSNNPFQKQPAALTINGTDYTLPEVAYFYNNARQYEAMYASWGMSSYSPSLPDNVQVRTAAQDAHVDESGNQIEAVEAQSYAQYFREAAIQNMESTAIWYSAAVAAGADTVSAEGRVQIDADLRQIDVVCRQNNISLKSYFRQVFGEGMDKKLYVSMMERTLIAEAYSVVFTESHEISDADITNYYNENKNTYDLTTYNVFFVSGTPEEKLDNDGNKVDPTEEEKLLALTESGVVAAEVVSAVKDGTSFYDAAIVHDMGSEAIFDQSYYFKPNQAMSETNTNISAWLYDADRKLGDVTAIEATNGYYVVEFLARLRDDNATASIRHILINAETTDFVVNEDGTETVYDPASLAEGEEEPVIITKPSEEQWAAAQAEIERIQAEWLTASTGNGSLEDKFAELANQYSDDGGSNTTGGLYSEKAQDYFVPNFSAWVFETDRAAGDYGIVQNDGQYVGYHLIYYVGDAQPQWMIAIRGTLKQEASLAWYDAEYGQATITSYPEQLEKLGA